ncbi:Ty3/gypsy retrotransposon protein [Senna tora]|uniref:Ty3/gypsy retrotransposon protein n=2 Tax=Senna tora TaxID=362788 RepID=A0A834T1B6_9FABA|nr:Ty3/gypsy retrotransposon protein [Senna tora]
MTPYKALYGTDPSPLAGKMLEEPRVDSLDEWMKNREDLREAWVWVKLQQYRQKTAAQRLNFQLARRYYGPFQVMARVGQVAYRLALPSSSKVHPVFHVSLLKEFKGEVPSQLAEIPIHMEPFISSPKAIVDFRHVKDGDGSNLQALVEWEGVPREEATWEDWASLLKVFPHLNLEDKVIVHGGSIDMDIGFAKAQSQEPININSDSAMGEEKNHDPVEELGPVAREKRSRRAPAWVKDFVQ